MHRRLRARPLLSLAHTARTPLVAPYRFNSSNNKSAKDAEQEALANPLPVTEAERKRRQILRTTVAGVAIVAAVYAYNQWIQGVAGTVREVEDVLAQDAAEQKQK